MRIEGGPAVEWMNRKALQALVAGYYVSPRTSYPAWRASEFCQRLYRWKCRPDAAFTDAQGERLAAAVLAHYPAAGAFDVITCPPAGPHRIAAGWYPAGALAAAVGVRLDLDSLTCFERTGHGQAHASGRGAAGAASRAEPKERLGSVNVSGLRVLLVDDVLLTGQSLGRLHGLLTDAGAAVSCAVLARALRQSEVPRLAGECDLWKPKAT